ncbi:HEPN domain-containing protein [Asticcacaulis sp.]|uniref:HEPN domain-containing protein n=1 Tax=Asticcacaulis sp. TaxID=1872648 RepID=UPI00260F9F16|nr:HEPN domain-containing protein [Asticcacaulis sp.]
MPSSDYARLVARVDEIRLKFINFTIPADRNPLQEELDCIAAFRLLVHAEFEHFLEDRVRYALSESLRLWKTKNTVTHTLLNAFAAFAHRVGDDKLRSLSTVQDFEKRINDHIRQIEEILDKNNGIKKSAFSELAHFCGCRIEDLPSELIGQLHSFGEARGAVAHKRVDRVRSLNSPDIEAAQVKEIVDLLEQFDEAINSCVSERIAGAPSAGHIMVATKAVQSNLVSPENT